MDEPVDVSALQWLVQRHRADRGLSLRAAAEASGVPFNTLARVEKGHLPDLANFRRIVEWLGLPPERFFEPPRIRTESTPEIIAYYLSRDPNLSDAAADRIASLVRELYDTMAEPENAIQVHLRAASTFTPHAARALGDLLETIQAKLESGFHSPAIAEDR
ncbi:transcriptional regulator with XRE-family HTH domain [Catenulispora sp. MAP12-49]|uniref:helix-turn-helix domain-containing protein n=1 Tax=Catenulispora sp. MAP12-49 TaxID=3156302 RepID=UPI0035142759